MTSQVTGPFIDLTSLDNIGAYNGIADGYADCSPALALYEIMRLRQAIPLRGLKVGANQRLRVRENVTITGTYYVEPGGGFLIDSGKTLTINGYVIAEDYQIFFGSGTASGTFGGNPSKPEWWGLSSDADPLDGTEIIEVVQDNQIRKALVSEFGGGGGSVDGEFDTVADMLASLTAADGEGTVWRADGFRYREADPAATDHHLTTAGGVKLYVQQGDDGWYNFLAMNPARDGVTNDAEKFKKLLAIRPLGVHAPGSNPWPEGPSIHVPAGDYAMAPGAWGFQINAVTRIRGESYSPGGWQLGTMFRFPVDCGGFQFNHYDTYEDYIAPAKPYGYGGTIGSQIERMFIHGVLTNGGGNPDAIGLWIRTAITVRDCAVDGFNGDGIRCVGTSSPGSFLVWTPGTSYPAGSFVQADGGHKLYILTTAGAGPSTVAPSHTSGAVTEADGYRWTWWMDPKLRGGPNHCMFYGVTSVSNGRNGVYIDGGDSNASSGVQMNASANGRFGIFDSNFLGNTWIACHSRTNGLAGSGGNPPNKSAVVSLRDGPPTGTPATLWVTGTNYALTNNILASNGNYYVCTVDPGGATLSTVEPSHAGDAITASGQVIESDGYGWSRAGTYNKYYARFKLAAGLLDPALEAALVATKPGTNEDIWVTSSLGGFNNTVFHPYYPVWQPGQPAGTYFAGSGYVGDNANARNQFIGCYAEGDEPPGYLSPTSFAVGGIASWQKGSGHIYSDDGNIATETGWRATDTFDNDVRIGGDSNSSATLFRAMSYKSWQEPLSWIWQYGATAGDWILQYGASSTAYNVTSVNTVNKMGTSKTQPFIFHAPTLAIGGSTTTRRHSTNSVKPTTGEYAAGDIVWNTNTATNSYVGWVCTTAGAFGSTAWTTGTNYAVTSYVLASNGKYYRCCFDPGGTDLSTIEPSHASGEVFHRAAKEWVSGTDYVLNAFILASNGKYYRCAIDPGALASTNEPTHANGQVTEGDGYAWLLVPPWVGRTNYALNNIVLASNGKYYRCTVDPGTFLSDTEPSHSVGSVIGADGYVWTFISTLWTTGTNYALNDLVLASNGKYYRVSTDAGGILTSTVEPLHASGAVAHNVTASTWTTGTNYALNAIILAANGEHYHCTTDPGGATLSTNQPTHGSGTVVEADGYGWTYGTWITGTNYSLNFYIRASNGNYYRCSVDPGGATLSTNEPTHGSGEVVEADTYGWTYMPGADKYGWTWVADIGAIDGYGWAWVSDTVVELLPWGQTVDLLEVTGALTLSSLTHPRIIIYTASIAGTVALGLSTTGAFKGSSFRITRTGGGVGSLTIGTGPLKTLADQTWCEVNYNGTAWILTSYGTL